MTRTANRTGGRARSGEMPYLIKKSGDVRIFFEGSPFLIKKSGMLLLNSVLFSVVYETLKISRDQITKTC